MPLLPRPAFCLVTSGAVLSADDGSARALVQLAVRATRAGVNVVQIRESQLADRDLYDLARRVLEGIDRSQTRVLINDRADVALAAGADGVHVRADGVAVSRLRQIAPAQFIIGRSVHSAGEGAQVEAEGGVDYVMFGTVFPSAGKPDGHPIAGMDGLSEICASVRLPVIAIGGMTLTRVPDVAAAGAAGFAAIGMFAEAGCPGAEAMPDLQEARRLFDTRSRRV